MVDPQIRTLTLVLQVYSWGRCAQGRLGRLAPDDSTEPRIVDVGANARVSSVTSSYGMTLAMATSSEPGSRRRSSSMIHMGSTQPPRRRKDSSFA